MIAALDVQYDGDSARAACVVFSAWTDARPTLERTIEVDGVADYEPGSFYKRELPVLEQLLATISTPLDIVVVDGYVWLDEHHTRPGLGARLHEALGGNVPLVGVAKSAFAHSGALELKRGDSKRPLYVTSEGIPLTAAAHAVASMHGPYRIPTLLRRVDALARGR